MADPVDAARIDLLAPAAFGLSAKPDYALDSVKGRGRVKQIYAALRSHRSLFTVPLVFSFCLITSNFVFNLFWVSAIFRASQRRSFA
jgi:hypothetical protein